ncbi:hypothetical protein [Streptomyces sp. GC420]|uniref:hypothetical protein n=1 Tax=Streptomyces sp. GC420 TaxID=2697568 RepID=UPI00141518BC|nr:hypothetical protein [Streptomyces sp. GC420]NBM18837.1 hypothetical protein [Streptomyces sp. GC420]
MARLTRQQELDVHVDFYGRTLQELHDTFVPVPYPDGHVGGRFVSEYPGRIDVESAGHTHTAALRVEVWDGEPPAEAPGSWDEQGDVRIRSESGQLIVWGVAGGPMPETVRLSDTGGTRRARIRCTGREEVRRLAQQGVAHGVERYLAQLWPDSESTTAESGGVRVRSGGPAATGP